MELNLCMGCMREKTQPGPCPHCGFDDHAYVPSSHHLPPQTILAGKYLVGRVLGEGGFGITYLGWDLNLEMKVAIKECFPNGFVTRDCRYTNTITMMTGSRAEFYQKSLNKFVDEARRLGKFWRLPGIVAVRDYFQENKTAYIVMEFAEGETLKALLKRGGCLPAKTIFEMLRPVMESLEEIHAAGLIHRDISPDNLMVDKKGNIKLLDFGAARDFMTDGERSLSVMLKPGYAPEEQYRSRGHQGPWTDVYALCATMYRAITGQVPPESLDRMSEDILKRPSELGITIESAQEAALLKGMSVLARDRYQSMGELSEALSESLETPSGDKQTPKDAAKEKTEQTVQEKNSDSEKEAAETAEDKKESKSAETAKDAEKEAVLTKELDTEEKKTSSGLMTQGEMTARKKIQIMIGYMAVSIIAAIWLDFLMVGRGYLGSHLMHLMRISRLPEVSPNIAVITVTLLPILALVWGLMPILMLRKMNSSQDKQKGNWLISEAVLSGVTCLGCLIIVIYYSEYIPYSEYERLSLSYKSTVFLWTICAALFLWTAAILIDRKNLKNIKKTEDGRKFVFIAIIVLLLGGVYDMFNMVEVAIKVHRNYYAYFILISETICLLAVFAGHIAAAYRFVYKDMLYSSDGIKTPYLKMGAYEKEAVQKGYYKIYKTAIGYAVFGIADVLFIALVVKLSARIIDDYKVMQLCILFMLAVSVFPFAVQFYRNGGLAQEWRQRMKITEAALGFCALVICRNLMGEERLLWSNRDDFNSFYMWTWRIGILIWLISILFWIFKEKTHKKFMLYFRGLTIAAGIVILAGAILGMLVEFSGGYLDVVPELFLIRTLLAGHIAVVYLFICEDYKKRHISEKN